MIKAIVTGAGALLGQGVIKSLRASSLAIHVIAVDPSPLSAGLYWADAAHIVPTVSNPSYMGRIEQVFKRERPDIVFIGTDVELPIFARERDRLNREFGTHILVSDPDVVSIADDKWKTVQFLEANGFDCPRSCLPGDEERLIAEVGFPLIVKPRVGARSVGVRLVRNRSELRAALGDKGAGLIIQECVGGEADEYTAGALCFDGRCASIVMRRELRDGNTYRSFVDDYPEYNDLVRQWAMALQPFGPANFQFRVGADGRAKVFEINARFSGTTPLRGLAGFNEVEMSLRHILHGDPISQPPVHRLVFLRHWSEVAVEPEAVASIDGFQSIEPVVPVVEAVRPS